MAFEIKGTGVSFGEVDMAAMNGPKVLVLPVKSYWEEGGAYCRNLAGGTMTQIASQEQLNSIVELVKGLMDSCTFIWLPVRSDSVDGEYRNTYSGHVEKFMPWGPGQPDNIWAPVALRLKDRGYYDYTGGGRLCVSCTLSSSAVFQLRGLCKDSYMGELCISSDND